MDTCFAPFIFTSLLSINTKPFTLLAAYILCGCAVSLVCIGFASRRKSQIEQVSITEKIGLA